MNKKQLEVLVLLIFRAILKWFLNLLILLLTNELESHNIHKYKENSNNSKKDDENGFNEKVVRDA